MTQCPIGLSSGILGGPLPAPSPPDTGTGPSISGNIEGPCPDHGYTCDDCLGGWFCPPVQTPALPAPCGSGWPCYHCESGWFCAPLPENTATSTFFGSASTSSIVNPTPLSATRGYLYAGCYADEPNRVLSKAKILDVRKGMTNEQCVKFCQRQGFTLAGTEDGAQCFCGNVLLGSIPLSAGHCNVTCTGDITNSTLCGGSWALSVWSPDGSAQQESKPISPPNVVGHYGSAGERDLPVSLKSVMYAWPRSVPVITAISSPTALGVGGLEGTQSPAAISGPDQLATSRPTNASSVMRSILPIRHTGASSAAMDPTFATATSKALQIKSPGFSFGLGHVVFDNYISANPHSAVPDQPDAAREEEESVASAPVVASSPKNQR